MKTFKVNKNVNKEPYIFGLRVPFFFVFVGILVFVFFTFVNGISWLKLIISLIILIASHTILKRMNHGSILDKLTKDSFPNTIINDNYK